MIITIDGPTASGKSTIAYLLAQQLSAFYINSGLLFRAVGYVSLSNPAAVESETMTHFFEEHVRYIYTPETNAELLYDTNNITPFLKTAEIDYAASIVAMHPFVRQAVLTYQRTLADDHSTVVADGRDCGVVVFPQAEYKLYITASLDVRAYRWHLSQKNSSFTLEQCKEIVDQRDKRDAHRPVSPLRPADDALIIDTSHMTVEQVITSIVELLKKP
jgi:CMP/dCMP kinase